VVVALSEQAIIEIPKSCLVFDPKQKMMMMRDVAANFKSCDEPKACEEILASGQT
jgi:hypothetical protein